MSCSEQIFVAKLANRYS